MSCSSAANATAAANISKQEDGISINGWTFASHSGSISNSVDIDALHDATRIHSPEMTYLSNQLTITHGNIVINFNTTDALMACQQIYLRQQQLSPDAVGSSTTSAAVNTPLVVSHMPTPSALKVTASSKWSNSNLRDALIQGNSSSNSSASTLISSAAAIQFVNLPYDWTYTTDYLGTYSSATAAATAPVVHRDSPHTINMQLLQQQDPILWFASIPLYEDELHDNGIALLSLKVRVMKTCWLVLLSFWLRVDGVVVRVYETRTFHEFGALFVVREHTRYEALWSELNAARLPTEAALLDEPQKVTRKLKPCYVSREHIDVQ